MVRVDPFEKLWLTIRFSLAEVQLEPQYNGQGLGRLLMTALEDIGKKYKLVKVMLTVFKCPSVHLFFAYILSKYALQQLTKAQSSSIMPWGAF